MFLSQREDNRKVFGCYLATSSRKKRRKKKQGEKKTPSKMIKPPKILRIRLLLHCHNSQ